MRGSFAAVLLLLVVPSANAQTVRPDPGVEIGGKIVLGVRVRMRVPGSYGDPLGGVPLLAVDADGRRTAFQTDDAGLGRHLLSPGGYRVLTPATVTYGGHRYTWDIPVIVRRGVPVLELTQDNATPDAPVVAADSPPRAATTPSTTSAVPSAIAPAPRAVARQAAPRGNPLRGAFFTLGLGGTRAGDLGGLAATGGFGVRIGTVLATVNAADLTLTRGDSYPYYRDTFSNGESRCRNSENGQFASDADCIAIDTDYAASADLNLLVPGTRLFVGGGGRLHEDVTVWYGSVGAILGSSGRAAWILRGNAGSDYVSALVSVGFR